MYLELLHDLGRYRVQSDHDGQLLGCAGIAQRMGEHEGSCGEVSGCLPLLERLPRGLLAGRTWEIVVIEQQLFRAWWSAIDARDGLMLCPDSLASSVGKGNRWPESLLGTEGRNGVGNCATVSILGVAPPPKHSP